MAYNSLKSYWIWRRKKEAEEKAWRELGVDENIIAEIRDFDRIAYNSDDRFYKTKSKMTALGAVVHKICNIVFAVLRDEKALHK